MIFDPTNSTFLEWQEIDAQASTLMQRGIRLLATAQTNSTLEALSCFDSAFKLRRLLPVERVGLFAYGLAACWLNRGEALMRLPDADATHAVAAIQAYDQAIELLRKLPLHKDARFPRRLAIAYQNRGLALQTQNHSNLTEISTAFLEAIAVLDDHPSALISDRDYLLGTINLNLANAYSLVSDTKCAESAQCSARQAISFVSVLERDDADAAEVGLKARYILCRTIARHLSRAIANREAQFDNLHLATDVVEEALTLARIWEKKGVVRFRGIADELFSFGSCVSEKLLPNFLDEFRLEI